MNRRDLLSTLGAVGVTGLTGCVAATNTPTSYPDVADDATPLSFQVHRRVDGERLLDREAYTGLALVTEPDGLDSFRTEWMTEADEAFLSGTDFSTAVILGIGLITSGDSRDIDLVEVVRTTEGALHSYSHVGDPSMQDDAYPRGFVVRVETGSGPPPTTARHTHQGGNTDLDVTATPSAGSDG